MPDDSEAQDDRYERTLRCEVCGEDTPWSRRATYNPMDILRLFPEREWWQCDVCGSEKPLED